MSELNFSKNFNENLKDFVSVQKSKYYKNETNAHSFYINTQHIKQEENLQPKKSYICKKSTSLYDHEIEVIY